MIEVLDCTLRDGSHVNEGNFSKGDFSLIFNALNKVAVDYVEVGFLEPPCAPLRFILLRQ